jgi:hypothetical protein
MVVFNVHLQESVRCEIFYSFNTPGCLYKVEVEVDKISGIYVGVHNVQ